MAQQAETAATDDPSAWAGEEMADFSEMARGIIESNRYMVLGTTDEEQPDRRDDTAVVERARGCFTRRRHREAAAGWDRSSPAGSSRAA